jgi:hypothetical protein
MAQFAASSPIQLHLQHLFCANRLIAASFWNGTRQRYWRPAAMRVACGHSPRYKGRLDTVTEAINVCRSIKTLFNFEPPATDQEIRAASLQFVRKLSGFNSPSTANRAAFDRAVDEVAASAHALIGALITTAEPRDREIEAKRARARSTLRFGVRSTS